MAFYLYILRHAKSDWSGAGVADIDRPINARGRKASTRIGQWMQEHDYIPEKVISSPATRAKQTIELVCAEWGSEACQQIAYDDELYLADLDSLLECINLNKSGKNSLMLVAHNPGLDYLVNFLANKDTEIHQSLTTANLVIFEFPDDSFDANEDKGVLLAYIKPKEL